jgi:ParB family transcriptional regulator, chromosome partitioning protein
MTTDLQVPEVDIELIDVVEGFNSRKQMDETELAQLAATIEAHGIVQPFSVKPKDDGRFDLTFGHRRLVAAKRAGKKKVPVIPGKGNPRVEAFYENNHHAALNPLERALDTKALAEELGLRTNKAIAAVAGRSPIGSALTCACWPSPKRSSATSPRAPCRWRPSGPCARSPRSAPASRPASASW